MRHPCSVRFLPLAYSQSCRSTSPPLCWSASVIIVIMPLTPVLPASLQSTNFRCCRILLPPSLFSPTCRHRRMHPSPCMQPCSITSPRRPPTPWVARVKLRGASYPSSSGRAARYAMRLPSTHTEVMRRYIPQDATACEMYTDSSDEPLPCQSASSLPQMPPSLFGIGIGERKGRFHPHHS